jgi:alpha-tubulin suppressor-like RCC1 family protein
MLQEVPRLSCSVCGSASHTLTLLQNTDNSLLWLNTGNNYIGDVMIKLFLILLHPKVSGVTKITVASHVIDLFSVVRKSHLVI